jgi:hypothetical protein
LVSQPNLVRNIEIQYGVTLSDHIPIKFEINVDSQLFYNKCENHDYRSKNLILWNKLSDIEKQIYSQKVNDALLNYHNLSLQCRDKFCTSENHKLLLKKAYKYLLETLKTSSADLTVGQRDIKFKPVPGWTERVKYFHNIARQNYLIWNREGRMRLGQSYDRMKESRLVFKNALKECRRNEDDIKKNKLCNSYKIKNKKRFWKDVKNLKNNSTKKAINIDGETDSLKIAEIFSSKYKSILNDPACGIVPDNFNILLQQIKNECHSNNGYTRITSYHVERAINKMNDGISQTDNIHSEHLKICSKTNYNNLSSFISRLFTSMICHGYIPEEMLLGEIRPIIKNKFGDLSSSDNYRPVMNSSNLFKLFEYCILNKLNIELNTRQFGFRKGTSTVMAATVLKETVSKYIKNNSKVYATFLDLSKAFDKVNHNILICKMKAKGISPFIINTFDFMYRNQMVDISFNNSRSESWLIANGVRQGAVLSPLLFSLYIDDILNEISDMNVGCKIVLYRLNIIGYADDIVLSAPTSNGLQRMLDKLTKMLSKLCLMINTDKTVCMRFEEKKRIYSILPIITLNNNVLKFVDEYKYLGIIINKNLCNGNDIERCNKSFLRQFWSIYRRFSFADVNVISFLFKSHCNSFYGSQIWHNFSGCKKEYNALSVTYHKAVKIILNLPRYAGNHEVCESLDLLTFKHLLNKQIIKFVFNLKNNSNACFIPIKNFIFEDSSFIKNVKKSFIECYGINDILQNDIDAIESRIKYVQCHEERHISGLL